MTGETITSIAVRPPATRTTPTPRQSVQDFVVSGTVALAATWDAGCTQTCNCETWTSALWLYSLDPKAPSAIRVPIQAGGEARSPALAMGPSGGAAAFRVGATLHLLWLDRDGKPIT